MAAFTWYEPCDISCKTKGYKAQSPSFIKQLPILCQSYKLWTSPEKGHRLPALWAYSSQQMGLAEKWIKDHTE